jgi:putative copper resistance protein D
VLVMLALLIQWRRSDDRTAKRLDRAADRDDDAELAAYNNMLAKLAEAEHRTEPRK